MYPGMGNIGERRKESGTVVSAGKKVKVVVDLDKATMRVYEDKRECCSFTSVKGNLYFALTICHNSPMESYTLQPN